MRSRPAQVILDHVGAGVVLLDGQTVGSDASRRLPATAQAMYLPPVLGQVKDHLLVLPAHDEDEVGFGDVALDVRPWNDARQKSTPRSAMTTALVGRPSSAWW